MSKKTANSKQKQSMQISANTGCTVKEVTRESLTAIVQKRAHEIFLQRGSVPGSQLSDWLRAEKEIKNKYGEIE